MTPDGEPLNRETRKVQVNRGSAVINLTRYAAKTHGIGEGDELPVETHPEGILIRVNE